jgi:DNA-binding NarL/FixJ family response regulator
MPTSRRKEIREMLKEAPYVSPPVTQHLLDRLVRDPSSSRDKELTPRQRQVLQLLVEGRTMKETGKSLHLTPRTVAFHKYKIMEEFGLKTNPDLVKFAIRERLIPPP